MKYEKEEKSRLKAEEEAHLVKDAMQEAKEHDNAQLKVEEGVSCCGTAPNIY